MKNVGKWEKIRPHVALFTRGRSRNDPGKPFKLKTSAKPEKADIEIGRR
jgi:hypothetical protein